MRRLSLVVLAGALAAAPSAESQTNDVFYRSWQWLKEPSAGRAAGLAGAMTAVADDASSLESNPGAVASLSRLEVVGALLGRGSGRTVVGDSVRAGTGLGFVGAAGRISSRFSAGAYLAEPVAARIDLAPLRLPDGSRDEGSLRGRVRDAGVSAAWRVTPRLHVGARLTATRLTLTGDYRRQPDTGLPKLSVVTQGGETRLAASYGLLYEATPSLRLGLVRLSGASWTVGRTAESPALGVALDPGSEYEVRQPSVISGGASLRLSPRVMVTGQLDYVRYGEIQASIATYPGGYAREAYAIFAWEPRIGMEVSLPRGAYSVQVRAGLHALGLNALGSDRGAAPTAATPIAVAAPAPGPPPAPSPGPLPLTPDVTRALALQEVTQLREPSPRVGTDAVLRFAIGGSVVTARGFRFDVAARFGGERSAFLVGAAVRF